MYSTRNEARTGIFSRTIEKPRVNDQTSTFNLVAQSDKMLWIHVANVNSQSKILQKGEFKYETVMWRPGQPLPEVEVGLEHKLELKQGQSLR